MMDSRLRFMLWAARRKYGEFDPHVPVERFRLAYAGTNARFGLRDRGGVSTEDVAIPVEDETILARIYRPAGLARPAPALLFFHGGGFVIGDVASYDHLTRFFAREGELAVISVDYRLGPEYRFPRAHEDAFAALHWAQVHAAAYGIDTQRIAVGGDSAGGNLAAALSAFAAERGFARPAFQLLIYPTVDARHDYPSMRTHTKKLPLTPTQMSYFTERYASSPDDAASPLFSPLSAPFPERLPPTYILAAKYDPLLDEGKAYAERLQRAGVPVTYDFQASLPHAFVNLAGAVPAAERALRHSIRKTSSALRAL